MKEETEKTDWLERISRWMMLATLVAAILTAVSAPLLALSWFSKPFPGFLVEHSLIVNDSAGQGWSGLEAGITKGQQVLRAAGTEVTTPAEFNAVITSHGIGEEISIFTRLPDGSAFLYPSVILEEFPARDRLRLFWLPYLVGLIYLGIGIWVYLMIGKTRPGRALAAFCVITSISTMLIFDLGTTHAGVILWVVCVAQVGGTLVNLAIRFPEEWHLVRRFPWILGIPYLVSAFFSAWGIITLYDKQNPWSYYGSWGANYVNAGIGVLFFLGVMVYHAWTNPTVLVRQQARIILLGSVLAFVPITVFFISPAFGGNIAFDAGLLTPMLVIFPLSAIVAIMRYRLHEFDALVNQAVVYGLLTAFLGGIFTAVVVFSQRVFIALTGEKRDAAIIITTFIVGSAAAPVRARLQDFVDRKFAKGRDKASGVKTLGNQVQAFLEMHVPERLLRRLLDEASTSLQAESAALIPYLNGGNNPTLTHGNWRGEPAALIPIEHDGYRHGLLFLGRRKDEKPYTREELAILQTAARQVAQAISLQAKVAPTKK